MSSFRRAAVMVGLGLLFGCGRTPSSLTDRGEPTAAGSMAPVSSGGVPVAEGGAATGVESTPSLAWAVVQVADPANPRVMAARIENGRIVKSRDPVPGTGGVEWNCLADGRYLVSSTRTVLDVVTGATKSLDRVEGISCKGNWLVRTDGSIEPTFERYEFSTGRWLPVRDEGTTALWRIAESKADKTSASPNGRYEASIRWTPVKADAGAAKRRWPTDVLHFTGELVLRGPGGSEKTIATGFSRETFAVSSPYRWMRDVLWLDNRRMIVEQRKGQLLLVTIDGQVAAMNPATGSGPYPAIETQLWMDGAGGILYDPSGIFYRVDVETREVEPTEWYGLGAGFEVSLRTGGVRHREQDVCGGICEGNFDPNDLRTSYRVWPGAVELRCSANRTLRACVHGGSGWQRVDFGFSGRVLGWVGEGWE